MNNCDPKNIEYIMPMIRLFQEHGGFWSINHHEDNSLEIEWRPNLTENGKYHHGFFYKRCYNIKEYLLEIETEINRVLDNNYKDTLDGR